MDDADLARLDARLRGWAEQRDLSGVALITRADEVEFEGYFGLANRADGVPVRPGTRFGLASLTKMFTAVAVADAVHQRLVAFETPVISVLPPELRPSTLRPDVTVHHLLTHSSGIADYFEEDVPDGGADYAGLWHDRPCYRMRRPADFLPLFADLPPYREPGERFQYSNAGYILLGLLLEELTRLPYPEAIQQAVFEPAEMAGSGFFALDEVHQNIATGYLRPAGPDQPWRTNVYSIPAVGGPDGGAFATAVDCDRFLRAFDDGTLTGAALRDAMLTRHLPIEDGGAIGYGIFLTGEGRGRRYGHGGGDPGCGVLIHRLPELDTHVIVLCNVNDVVVGARDLLVEAVLSS
jgi:CubicO group peptidase (beta-lactamase class C family)